MHDETRQAIDYGREYPWMLLTGLAPENFLSYYTKYRRCHLSRCERQPDILYAYHRVCINYRMPSTYLKEYYRASPSQKTTVKLLKKTNRQKKCTNKYSYTVKIADKVFARASNGTSRDEVITSAA